MKFDLFEGDSWLPATHIGIAILIAFQVCVVCVLEILATDTVQTERAVRNPAVRLDCPAKGEQPPNR